MVARCGADPGFKVPRARARKNCSSVDAERAGVVPAQVAGAMGLTTTLILGVRTATHLTDDRKSVGVSNLAETTTQRVISFCGDRRSCSQWTPLVELAPSVIRA